MQDQYAIWSHEKAERAQRTGKFDSEIVPVETYVKEKDGVSKKVIVTKDDGIRSGISPDDLAKLKPVFRQRGTTTAGNASQVTKPSMRHFTKESCFV
jgi:acetyl-CoA acyltransferase 1